MRRTLARRATELISNRGWPVPPGLIPQLGAQKDLRVDTEDSALMQFNEQRQLVWSGKQFVSGETRQTSAPEWSNAIRPTHFLSLRLAQNTRCYACVQKLHEYVAREFREYVPLLVPTSKLHLTLAVVSLNEGENGSPDQKSQIAVMEDVLRRRLSSELVRPFTLQFRRLATFHRGRVVFVQANAEYDYQRLDEFVSGIRKELHQAGIDIKGNPYDNYVPHITVAKVRPKHKKELGVHVVPKDCYVPLMFEEFGGATFNQLELCCMHGKAKDGFYPVLDRYTLVDSFQ